MARLITEKRLVVVDTSTEDAGNFAAGDAVIDSTNGKISVSNGTAWTDLPLGGGSVAYADLPTDEDLSNGATANTVPSSSATKSYVDANANIIWDGDVDLDGATIDTALNGIYNIVRNVTINTDPMVANGTHVQVFNYTNSAWTIMEATSGNGIYDVSAGTSDSGIELLPGQKVDIVYAARGNGSESPILAFLSSI
jgi:hypothetical protein